LLGKTLGKWLMRNRKDIEMYLEVIMCGGFEKIELVSGRLN
jgi:hypothetical protein